MGNLEESENANSTVSTADTINMVVERIIHHVKVREWSSVDRLQKVLNELVKIEVAKIESGKL